MPINENSREINHCENCGDECNDDMTLCADCWELENECFRDDEWMRGYDVDEL